MGADPSVYDGGWGTVLVSNLRPASQPSDRGVALLRHERDGHSRRATASGTGPSDVFERVKRGAGNFEAGPRARPLPGPEMSLNRPCAGRMGRGELGPFSQSQGPTKKVAF